MAINKRNAVKGNDCFDGAITPVNQLPNGNQLVEQRRCVKDTIAQASKSANGNPLAKGFECIKDAIAKAINHFSNWSPLSWENYESICNLITSMFLQRVEGMNDPPVGSNSPVLFDRLQRLPSSTMHPKHTHELHLKDNKESYNCNGCKMRGFGQRYNCEQCSFNLHPICEISRPTSPPVLHDLVPNSTFKFFYERPGSCKKPHHSDCSRLCEACAQPTKGYVYYEEGKEKDRGINFHPCCFIIPSKLNCEGNEYELSTNGSSKCQLKGKTHVAPGSVTGNLGWFYVSTCENKYNFHVYCAMNMSLEKWNDGNLSLAKKDQKKFSKKYGKNFDKAIKFAGILVRLLLGDLSVLIEVVGLVVSQ